jgi:hypothetical protein
VVATSVNKTKAKLAAVIRARKIEEAIAAARCRQWHLLCDTLWGRSADTNAGYDGYEQSLEVGARYLFHGRIIPRSARCPVWSSSFAPTEQSGSNTTIPVGSTKGTRAEGFKNLVKDLMVQV